MNLFGSDAPGLGKPWLKQMHLTKITDLSNRLISLAVVQLREGFLKPFYLLYRNLATLCANTSHWWWRFPSLSCPPERYYEATIPHMLCLCWPCWHLAACRGVMPGSSKEQSSWCVVYKIRPWAGPHRDRTSLHSDSRRGKLPSDAGENILKDSVRKQRPRGDSFSYANVLIFFLHDLHRRPLTKQGRSAGCYLFWPLIPRLKLRKIGWQDKNRQDSNTEWCLKAVWRGSAILLPAAACQHTHTPSCLSTSHMVLVWIPVLSKLLGIRLSLTSLTTLKRVSPQFGGPLLVLLFHQHVPVCQCLFLMWTLKRLHLSWALFVILSALLLRASWTAGTGTTLSQAQGATTAG